MRFVIVLYAIISMFVLIMALVYWDDAVSVRERKRMARIVLAFWAWPVYIAVILVRGVPSLIKDAIGVGRVKN